MDNIVKVKNEDKNVDKIEDKITQSFHANLKQPGEQTELLLGLSGGLNFSSIVSNNSVRKNVNR